MWKPGVADAFSPLSPHIATPHPPLSLRGLQSSSATLYYWPVKARNVLSLLIAHKAGIAITQTTPDW